MNKLLLFDKSKDLYVYIVSVVLSSYPKVHIHYKIKLEDSLSCLVENISYANFNTGNIKKKYMKDSLVNVSMIDFYIGVMYKLKIIKSDKYKRVLKLNDEIKSLLYGWIKSEEVYNKL